MSDAETSREGAAISGSLSSGGSAVQRFWRSTVGKKVVMATTGLIMVAWIILHMLGNLQIFAGPERLNNYSAMLHGPLAEVLWLTRAVLLVAVVLHIISAYQLTRIAMAARPTGYTKRDPQVSTFAAQTIRWGGVLLLIFIVFHLLHMTTGTLHPDFVPGDVYSNVTVGLRVWPVALFYLLAMVALGLHLYHGTWAALRTLGLARPSAHPLQRNLITALAIIIAGGFAIVPLGIMLGLLH